MSGVFCFMVVFFFVVVVFVSGSPSHALVNPLFEDIGCAQPCTASVMRDWELSTINYYIFI